MSSEHEGDSITAQPIASSSTAQGSISRRTLGRPRVWKACETCRKRKIRCDGKNPCDFCTTNNKACSFTRAEDHASKARQLDNDTQSRLERLENSLSRLIPLIETTHAYVMRNESGMASEGVMVSRADTVGAQGHHPPAAQPTTQLTTLPTSLDPTPSHLHVPPTSSPSRTHLSPSETFDYEQSHFPPANTESHLGAQDTGMQGSVVFEDRSQQGDGGLDVNRAQAEDEEEDGVYESYGEQGEGDLPVDTGRTWADRLAGRFAKDSMGNMRYLGGAPTFVLSDAIDSVRHAHRGPTAGGSSTVPNTQPEPLVDHLYFRPNVFYRPFTALPGPENLDYPPFVLSDALVQMYFSKIHHTFPILDKPKFMRQYNEAMLGLRQGNPSRDTHFLCVLFSVYASAASLTKKHFQERAEPTFADHREYIGVEFYEKAMYMFWNGFRMNTIETVTCLALLSSCLAGWNTLAHAWVLAGQAVRSAQDIGLHRSPEKGTSTQSEKEYRRRVWWCVYGLDKNLSVCLGRPSGINDEDCDVELPSDDTCCEGVDLRIESPGDNPMTGFRSLLNVHIIMGQIETRAHNIKFLKGYDNVASDPHVREVIDKLDLMLNEWSDTLPDSIKYAANHPERPDMFALCLLGHFTLYACTLNLHRPFMPDFNTSDREETMKSLHKCVDAAQGCIRVGEEIKRLLPNSHHCQFCVQYLTISGVTLLRCLPYVSDPSRLVNDAAKCRHLLAQLEDTWAGSKRCGALLQELMEVCQRNPQNRSRSAGRQGSALSRQSNGLAPRKKRRISQNTNPPAVNDTRANPASLGLDTTFEHTAPHVSAPPSHLHAIDFDALSTPAPGLGVDPNTKPTNMDQMLSSLFNVDNLMTPDVNWESFRTGDFQEDYSFLNTEAPFDLANEVTAFWEQMQGSVPMDLGE